MNWPEAWGNDVMSLYIYERIKYLKAQPNNEGKSFEEIFQEIITEKSDQISSFANFFGVIALTEEQCFNSEINFEKIPLAESLHEKAIWLNFNDTSYILIQDPLNRLLRENLQNRFNNTQLAISFPGVLDKLLSQVESQQKIMDGVSLDLGDDTLAKAVESITLTTLAKDESPVIRLLNMTLYDALKNRASDIHLESYELSMLIRYRIDGVLREIREIPAVSGTQQIISRVKVLSNLDIAEKRIPQDGRFSVVLQGREVDFRVSIMPGIYGENAVLRLLDKNQCADITSNLNALGFDYETIQRIRELSLMPYGLTLITGPTGSGKSTTLYSLLAELHTGEEKIITIEDPVEREMKGVLQIPVNEKKGLTFSRGLRSILRHDPDTILVGEIRDAETAAIAVQSALTGHRVFSSVHANDSFSVIDRFIYMGVEASTFLESLNGVVSQRLVRKSCTSCATSNANFNGIGCEACQFTGFSGRLALAEVVRLDDSLKSALLSRDPQVRQARLRAQQDYQSLKDAAERAIDNGWTTRQEIQRVLAF